MNEKYIKPNDDKEPIDTKEKETEKLGGHRFWAITKVWATILTILALQACGDKISDRIDKRKYNKDPIAREIKQQEKIDNLEADLKWVKHQKEEKIKQRKPIVKNYVDKMKEYEEGGKQNKALQNKLYQLSKDINEYNNEIISLSKKQAALEKELNHKQSKTSNEMPNWNPLTDPDYFDFELDEDNTANYIDYVDDGNIEHIENEIEHVENEIEYEES